MPPYTVENKVFVITGSGRGLGKAFALRLLESGGKVCLSDITWEQGEEALVELRERFGEKFVCLVPCDVTSEEQFSNLLDQAEKFFQVDCIDVLVNNAGIFTHLGWRKCLDVTLMGVMIGTQLAMQRMRGRPQHGHQIINTCSSAAFITFLEEEGAAYQVAKAGVLALTRSLAMDYQKHGVLTKCICPHVTETAFLQDAFKVSSEPLVTSVKDMASTGGLLTPDEVAEGFLRLITECGSGAAVYVGKGQPYMEVPDYNMVPMFLLLTSLAWVVDKVARPSVVKTRHHVITFFVLLFITFILVSWMF